MIACPMPGRIVLGEVNLLFERDSGWQVLPNLFARRWFSREAFKLAAEARVQMVGGSPIDDRLESLLE